MFSGEIFETEILMDLCVLNPRNMKITFLAVGLCVCVCYHHSSKNKAKIRNLLVCACIMWKLYSKLFMKIRQNCLCTGGTKMNSTASRLLNRISYWCILMHSDRSKNKEVQKHFWHARKGVNKNIRHELRFFLVFRTKQKVYYKIWLEYDSFRILFFKFLN